MGGWGPARASTSAIVPRLFHGSPKAAPSHSGEKAADPPEAEAAQYERCNTNGLAGLSQAEAIDPSVTSPLCAAKAAMTSSFSREGTSK